MAKNITVIGDGAMGTICSIMLSENGHNVCLWSGFKDQAESLKANRENLKFLPGKPIPDQIQITDNGSQALGSAQPLVSAVPSQFVRPVWKRLAKHYHDLPICSVSKGIENDTLLLPTQVLEEVLNCTSNQTAVLSGPSIVPEIAQNLLATVTVASTNINLAKEIQQLIYRPYFRVYTSHDQLGVELAGATKNVIAIAAGILDGMKLGDNAKAALITRGLVEITRLGIACGAQLETFSGLAGLGDLIATCFSPIGRNRSFGQEIGTNHSVKEALDATDSVVEGVKTTISLMALAKQKGVDMPLAHAVYKIIIDNISPEDALNQLINRPLKHEGVGK